MAHRLKLSKEDMEATFDAFLKTSVSSEDDTEKINELLRNPRKAQPKNQGLWWMDDNEKKKAAPASKSFLKSKKPVSADSSGRVHGLDSPSRSPRGKLAAKHGLAKKNKPDRSKGKGGRESSPGKGKGTRGRGPSDVSMSKDSLEDISEKSEEHDLHGHNAYAYQLGSSVETTRESMTTDGAGSVGESDRSPGKPGFDTLDELADKQKFFQDLESKANESLDYSQLNRELSATGTMFSPGTGVSNNIPRISDDSPEASPAPALHPQARDDDLDLSVDRETSSNQKPSMLSKVSLDSTLNTTTSPQVPGAEDTGSRDTTQDNLGQTLPETLKTQGTAGAIGTNTSREMEELQQALREVGMSPTLVGLDSRTVSGRDTGTGSAPLSRKPTDRSMGQILQEMDAIRERQQAIDAESNDVKLMSDYKGSRSPRSPGLHRQGHMEDQDRGGFDNSHTEDTEVYQPVTAMSVSEKPSKKKTEKSSSTPNSRSRTMEERGRRSSRDRYSHVQSSGYGKRSPEVTPRKSPSPSLSPIRPAGRGRTTTTHISLDTTPTSRKSSLSPSPRRPKQDARPTSQTRTKGHKGYTINPALSDEEPNQTKYTRTGVSGVREEVLIEELKDLRTQLQEERQKNMRLLAEQATQEREITKKTEAQRLDYEEQIFKLKQENFVLAARLKDQEAQTGVKGSGGDAGGSNSGGGEAPSAERVARLEKECREQEELLARFQAENKRLYEEIRSKEKAAKATEEAMFKENQRLSAEMMAARSQLEQKEAELRSKGIITSLAAQQQIAAGNQETGTPSTADTTRRAYLEGDLQECKRQHENTLRELKALQKSRSELEQHVEALVMEREMIRKQLNAARQARPEQLQELERKHSEEVERLTRKLKWYAENQELLDKGTKTIRAREDEIHKLKIRIEELQTEAGRRVEQNKVWSKQKTSDAKKIQDLERQIKEMEQIVRRRHPNSLPALMLAAATVPDPAEGGGDNRGRTVNFLEKHIKKLEGELEKKDEEWGTLLRGMEQKYNAVKLQFEERVADLESQLEGYRDRVEIDRKAGEHRHTHTFALGQALEGTHRRYRRQVDDLSGQVERLTGELTKLRKQQDNSHRSEQQRWQQVEKDLRQQVATLQAAVEERDRDLATVMATVERQKKSPSTHTDKRKAKNGLVGEENYGHTGLNTFPEPGQSSKKEKVYQPEAFADQQTSDIIQENMDLRNKLEMLQLERDQQRVDLRRSLAETEAIARRSREDYENQLASLKQAHEKEVTRIRAEQAAYNSTSKLAALQSRCDSQEVMVQHLQRQLAVREEEMEEMGVVKKREEELRQRVEDLHEKLREAKRTQAPEMRHYEALEEKISRLTERHSHREQELQSLLRSSRSQRLNDSQDLAEEAARWKKMVDTKNMEICRFREELDSILGVLRELQRQGIKLPCVLPV